MPDLRCPCRPGPGAGRERVARSRMRARSGRPSSGRTRRGTGDAAHRERLVGAVVHLGHRQPHRPVRSSRRRWIERDHLSPNGRQALDERHGAAVAGYLEAMRCRHEEHRRPAADPIDGEAVVDRVRFGRVRSRRRPVESGRSWLELGGDATPPSHRPLDLAILEALELVPALLALGRDVSLHEEALG